MNKDSKQIPHGGVLWMNFRFWIVPLFLVAYTTILLNLFSPVPIRYDGKKEPVIPDEFKALYLPKPATPLKLWPDEQKEKVITHSR